MAYSPFPDVGVALWVDLLIKPSLLVEHIRKPGVISPICFDDDSGNVAADPILPAKAFFNIGGAGRSSDAMAIRIAQFVGREIRLLDYIEGVSQPLSYYATELRRRGWKEGDHLLAS